MPHHKQVFVKVNAPVDVGVAGIVSALAGFDKLETVESCEKGSNESAWVCFLYGDYWEDPWRDLVEFAFGQLAPHLIAEVGDDAGVRVQSTPGGVFGELTVRPGAETSVECALRTLAEKGACLKTSSRNAIVSPLP